MEKNTNYHFRQFLNFGLVGIIGSITNLLIFFIVADLLGWNETLSAIVSFSVAVSQNYLLNNYWTYKAENKKRSMRQYIHFVCVSLLGLFINLLVLKLVLTIYPNLKWVTIAQMIGIGAAFGVNFLGSHFFVFKKAGSNG
jgi:putative flippase GtrA